MQHYDDEAGDSVAMMASPDAKPQAAGAAPPQMGGGASDRPQNAAKAMLGRAFIPNSDGQQGGMFGGMKKKVFSMADLAGAVSNAGSMSPFGAISRPKKPPAPVAAADDDDIGVDSDAEGDEDDEMQGELLSHTAGGLALHEKPKGGMFRVQSKLEMGTQFSPIYAVRKSVSEKKIADQLLVVFDMDHTMVGDLVALSDRDNIETNVPWTHWPEGCDRGLSPDFILPFLQRGMLRPGMLELIRLLRQIGATIVVYTHSEEKWASKVCEAMERMAGVPFIKRIFSRMDCKDGHPEFAARKSLDWVVSQMQALDHLKWTSVDRTIFFDDDGNALGKAEADRLVKVASYDYWEPCQWDEVVNEKMMRRNPPDLADMVRRSVVEWGVAAPSYVRSHGGPVSAEEEKRDVRWSQQLLKKEQILLSFNKVARLDRVMFDVATAFQGDLDDLESLPERTRVILGNAVQPQTRRKV